MISEDALEQLATADHVAGPGQQRGQHLHVDRAKANRLALAVGNEPERGGNPELPALVVGRTVTRHRRQV